MDKSTKGQRTRDDILQTSARLFSLHGYHNTSTADILDAVTISKGAFYYHFRSKQDLAQAILTQMRADYQQKLIKPVMALESPGSRPNAMLEMLVELNGSNSWFNCLLLVRLALDFTQMDSPLTLQINEIMVWLNDIWLQLIVEAQSLGSVRSDLDPRDLAQMLFAALSGAIINREIQGDSNSLEQIVGQIKQLIAS